MHEFQSEVFMIIGGCTKDERFVAEVTCLDPLRRSRLEVAKLPMTEHEMDSENKKWVEFACVTLKNEVYISGKQKLCDTKASSQGTTCFPEWEPGDHPRRISEDGTDLALTGSACGNQALRWSYRGEGIITKRTLILEQYCPKNWGNRQTDPVLSGKGRRKVLLEFIWCLL